MECHGGVESRFKRPWRMNGGRKAGCNEDAMQDVECHGEWRDVWKNAMENEWRTQGRMQWRKQGRIQNAMEEWEGGLKCHGE
jgi:hypothetical protein